MFHGLHLGFLDVGEVDETGILGGVNQLQLLLIGLDGIVQAMLVDVLECLIEHLVVAAQDPRLALLGQLQVLLPDVLDLRQAALHMGHRQHIGRSHVGVLVVMGLHACGEGLLVVLESCGTQVIVIAFLRDGLVHAPEA